jgi:YegS/Rv2252/BmrU family lipid kinase
VTQDQHGGWWGIVNPGAGNRKDTPARVRAALDRVGVLAELRTSDSAAHIDDLVSEGIESGARRFLAVGGDGTINLVANALLARHWDSPPVLGVLPSGSGSDLIRSFDISQNLEEAASHLTGTDTAPLDAVHLSGPWGERYFVNSAGSGLTGGVVEEVERMPAGWGAARYQLGIWPALVKLPHARLEVMCGDHRFEGDALMLIMSNAKYLGGGMKMAPHADPADGMVNMQIFHGPKRLALTLKPMVQRGKHLDHPNVTLMSGKKFSIKTEPDWPIEADGEYLGRGDIEGSVAPQALELKI